MRSFFLLAPIFLLQSCFLLFPSQPELILADLVVNHTSYTGLFGNENIEGIIENLGSSTVYDIKIRITVHLKTGKTSVSEFTIKAGVPPRSRIAFKERLYVTDSNGIVDLCIIDGHL
jgi:hypothetical protein